MNRYKGELESMYEKAVERVRDRTKSKVSNLYRQLMVEREQELYDALIEWGWTPPKKDDNPVSKGDADNKEVK